MASKLKSFNVENLRKYERKVVNTVALVIAVAGLLVFVFGGESFVKHLLRVPPHALMFLALASMVENVLRIYRYRFFSNALSLPVPWPRMVLYYVAGMALLPTPGKVGVLLRLWLLHEHHGIPYRRSTPLLVMDVLTDVLAMMTLIAIGIISLGHVEGHSMKMIVLGMGILAALTAGVVVILSFPKLAERAIKGLYAACGKRAPRLFATLKTVLRLLHGLMGWRVLLICTLFSFVAWASFGFALSYLVISMGHPIDWNLGGFALCAGTILGFLTMAPAGIGGAELGMSQIFHAFGTPFSVAVIATVLGRLAVIWIPVAVGFLVLPWALSSRNDTRPAFRQRQELEEAEAPTRRAPARAAARSKRSASRR